MTYQFCVSAFYHCTWSQCHKQIVRVAYLCYTEKSTIFGKTSHTLYNSQSECFVLPKNLLWDQILKYLQHSCELIVPHFKLYLRMNVDVIALPYVGIIGILMSDM